MNYVTDKNGNIATIEYWGSKEAAEASLKTLTNCSRCSNCSGCSYCSYCSSCSRCSDCSGCSYCSYCSSCSRCSDCSGCSGCSNCSNCSYCSKCSNCSYCSDCSDCSKQPIANIITQLWPICLRDDYTLKIGCQDHPIEKWLSFTDGQIQIMALEAPTFWKQWKPVIEVLYSQRKQDECS